MTRGVGTGRLTLDDFRHEALVETSSTNSECFERARKGALSGLWVTAARQTGGRGRRGRPWSSEAGNLYASLLLIDPAPVARLGSLPLADRFSVYGKFGFYRADSEVNFNLVVLGSGSASETNTDITFGVGLRYDFTRNLGLRAEWQRYGDVGDGATDVDVMSVGLIWKF